MDQSEQDRVNTPTGTTVQPETEILPAGTLIADKFRILSLLGTGGMGVVYKARNQLMNKNVALKMLHKHLVRSSQSLMRFQQEAKTASQLSHPNIIGVYDFGITPDAQAYQVMEYIDGKSLSDILSDNGPLSLERAMHIFTQACDGLEHAHENGIIHRDLKPSNLMIVSSDSEFDQVKIVDFGIAKMLPREGGDVLKLTQTGEVFGSPLYMSPEQCLGTQLDARSDIYAMGCLIYESLTGVAPFVGNSLFDTIYKQINDLPPSLAQVKSDLPRVSQLDAILLKCLAKDPDQRYDSMASLKEDLELVARGLHKSLFSQLTGYFDLLKIKSAPLRKKLPIKLIASLAAVIFVLMLTLGWISHFLMSTGSTPVFTEEPWPLYATRHPPPPENFEREEYKQSAFIVYAERHFVNDTTLVARALSSTGKLYARYGIYDKATRCFDRLLGKQGIVPKGKEINLLPTLTFEDSAEKAVFLKLLADSYYSVGRFQDAAPFYGEIAELLDHYPGAREQGFLDVYSKLADCDYRSGKLQEAKADYKAITDRIPEGTHMELLTTPDQWALFYSKAGDLYRHLNMMDEAKSSYRKAMDYWEKAKSDHDREWGILYYYEALISRARGHLPKAEKHITEAVNKLEKPLGNSRDFAGILQTKSEILIANGKWWEGLNTALKARSIWKSALANESKE